MNMRLAEAESCRGACSCALVVNGLGMVLFIMAAIPMFDSWYCISCFWGGLFMFTAFGLQKKGLIFP